MARHRMRGKQRYDVVYVTRDKYGNEMFHPPGELPPSMLKRAKTYIAPEVPVAPVRCTVCVVPGCEVPRAAPLAA
eukprot:452286-Amphidinium_carterae.1